MSATRMAMDVSCWEGGARRYGDKPLLLALASENAMSFVFRVAPAVKVVLYGHKCARFHSVDVQRSLQVVDLVLQNARVPALGVDYLLCAMFIEITHADATVAGDSGGVAGN